MRMAKIIFIVFLTLICASFTANAASKVGFIETLLRHSDDVARFGKKAGKLAPGIKQNLIKAYPKLARASDDIISGVYNIEKITTKNASAAKMVEQGINPARIATLTARSPKTIETGEKIAGIFAATKISPQAANKLPAPAVAALRKTGGNYKEAGEAFLQMERRGGARAVEVAGKLAGYITPGTVAGATAAALLAWHMADPEGAEASVEAFFKEHVGPMAAAPVKGIIGASGDVAESAINATGDAVETTLEIATARVATIASNHWPALAGIAFIILILFVPNLRRMPFIVLDSWFGRLNKKISDNTKSKPDLSNERNAPQSQPGFNVYKK